MNTEKRFYVYVWYKEDGTPFYVGKGTGDRYKKVGDKKRSEYFMRVYRKHDCHSEIQYDQLDEQSAFDQEKKTIKQFRELGYQQVNLTDGGEGTSGRQCDDAYRLKYHYMSLGEKNPNFGNKWTSEQKEAASQRAKARGWNGEKNPKARRVMCVETGKIYGCLDEAKKELGLASTASFAVVRNQPWRTARGQHWVFDDMIDLLDTEEKRKEYLKSLSSPYKSQSHVVET